MVSLPKRGIELPENAGADVKLDRRLADSPQLIFAIDDPLTIDAE